MFGNVPVAEWLISPTVSVARTTYLHDMRWQDVIDAIVERAAFLSCRRTLGKPNGKFHGCWRPELTVKLPATIVDAFHSGSGGIRAQYYFGADTGRAATLELLDIMYSKLETFWLENRKRHFLKGFQASFASDYCKIWIHQGPWLRGLPATKLCTLQVKRWQSSSWYTIPSGKPPHFASWPTLMPETETRIDFKGAWIKDQVVSDDGTVAIGQDLENHHRGYA
jgi:hypothetical protein